MSGLDRINSGSGGGPKNTPNPTAEQHANGGRGGVPYSGTGGSTPSGREAARNKPGKGQITK